MRGATGTSEIQSTPPSAECAGRYALPAPGSSEAFYGALFDEGIRQGMVSFEHDFVGQNSLDFGWPSQLGAGSAWLQGLGRAASSRRVPVQLCLATASDLLASLTLPWVTNARASGGDQLVVQLKCLATGLVQLLEERLELGLCRVGSGQWTGCGSVRSASIAGA